MFTKEAIQELAQAQAIAAADATVERADIAGLVALPSDFELHNLEQHQTYRRRARGTMGVAVHSGARGRETAGMIKFCRA